MAHSSTINYLKDFYSIGQLRIIYATLTDGGTIPGMDEKQRTERVDAIRHILNATQMPLSVNPVPQPMQPDKPEQPKTELAKASRLANGIVALLEDYCDRIHIAGSIRRQKPDVKDIEIVCQAKRFNAPGTGLFDTIKLEIVPGFRRAVEGLGKVIKGKYDGRYMQIDLPSGIKLDLFMPTAEDYFRQFAIRTGSADYSAKVIATGWKKKGWCGTDQGLRRIADCEETKSGWKCNKANPELPPYWKSEEEFFEWIGVPWLEPKLRTV